MSGSHIARPSAKMNTDIAVVGGGLSGTLAAYLLGRAGYAVTLIDRHRVFPQEFRSEKLGEDHIRTLQRFGLLAAISARATAFDTVANIHHGRLLDRTHRRHYGILYHDLVETIRAELPDTVRFVTGQVNGVRTSARRQRIAILGQDEVTARFLVLATGAGDILRRDLGISRRTVRARQSIAFGFNLHLFDLDCFPRAGLNHAGVTCYGEHAADGIDYLTLFPVAAPRAPTFLPTVTTAIPGLRRCTIDPTRRLSPPSHVSSSGSGPSRWPAASIAGSPTSPLPRTTTRTGSC